MAGQRLLLSCALLLICIFATPAASLPRSHLFTYADAASHQLANDTEDFNSLEVPLTTAIVFYQQTYHSIHVRNHGNRMATAHYNPLVDRSTKTDSSPS